MARQLILVGDRTSHGGAVLTGAPASSVGGKSIARIGDAVSCPAHGTNKIVEGEPGYAVAGLPAALEGHHTECGATLLASCSSSVG